MEKEIKKIGSNMTTYSNSKFWGYRTILISYKTPVAVFIDGEAPTVLFTREGLAKSKTTACHINKWVDMLNSPCDIFQDGPKIKKVEVTASAISLLA